VASESWISLRISIYGNDCLSVHEQSHYFEEVVQVQHRHHSEVGYIRPSRKGCLLITFHRRFQEQGLHFQKEDIFLGMHFLLPIVTRIDTHPHVRQLSALSKHPITPCSSLTTVRMAKSISKPSTTDESVRNGANSPQIGLSSGMV
jgi:hypothetical protein